MVGLMLDEVKLEVEEVMEENSNLRSTGDEPLLLITETLANPLSSDRLEEGLVSMMMKIFLRPMSASGQKQLTHNDPFFSTLES